MNSHYDVIAFDLSEQLGRKVAVQWMKIRKGQWEFSRITNHSMEHKINSHDDIIKTFALVSSNFLLFSHFPSPLMKKENFRFFFSSPPFWKSHFFKFQINLHLMSSTQTLGFFHSKLCKLILKNLKISTNFLLSLSSFSR